MLNKTIVFAVATVMLGSYCTSFAQGRSGGGVSSMGAGQPSGGQMSAPHPNDSSIRNSNGPGSLDADRGIDRASDRRSDSGKANANNPGSTDRDRGLDRAEDRRSDKARASTKMQKIAEAKEARRAKSAKMKEERQKDTFRTDETRESRMAKAKENFDRSRK